MAPTQPSEPPPPKPTDAKTAAVVKTKKNQVGPAGNKGTKPKKPAPGKPKGYKAPKNQEEFEYRDALRKKHLSTVSLFLKHWKTQTINEIVIVSDPTHPQNKALKYKDLAHISLSFSIVCSMAFFSVVLFLKSHPPKVPNSLITDESAPIIAPKTYFGTVWQIIGGPILYAFILSMFMAYNNMDKCNSFFKFLLWNFKLLRFIFLLALLFHEFVMIVLLYYRFNHLKTDHLEINIQKRFKLYIADDPYEKQVWEYTQKAFECCGVYSYKDFYLPNTTMTPSKFGFGVEYCTTANCKESELVPKLVPGYPLSCCQTRPSKCISPPVANQTWPQGCYETTKYWLKFCFGLMIAFECLNFLLCILALYFFLCFDIQSAKGCCSCKKKIKENTQEKEVVAVKSENFVVYTAPSVQSLDHLSINIPQPPESNSKKNVTIKEAPAPAKK